MLVNSEAGFDLAAHTTFQDRSHGPLSQPGGKRAGESNQVNVGAIDPATVDRSSQPYVSLERTPALFRGSAARGVLATILGDELG